MVHGQQKWKEAEVRRLLLSSKYMYAASLSRKQKLPAVILTVMGSRIAQVVDKMLNKKTFFLEQAEANELQ